MTLWPLPLAAFEEYMLLDDFVEHPMCFFSRLRFDRRLSSAAVDSALRDALARHPLLAARVEGKRGRWRWTPCHEPTVVVECESPDDSQYPPAAPLDLFASNGVRVWLQHVGDRSHLVVQFHHACTDGLGALSFLDDLLVGVARAANARLPDSASDPSEAESRNEVSRDVSAAASPGEQRRARRTSARSLDVESLRGRGKFGLTTWTLLKALPQLAIGLIGAMQFFGRKATPLAAPRDESRTLAESTFPCAISLELTPEETERHRQAATAAGATVNDALISELQLACGDWRKSRKLASPRDWIRICVPINLRTRADAQTPAANIVSMVFIDAPQGEPRADLALVEAAKNMQTIRDNRLGLILPLLLGFLQRLPGGMRGLVQSDDCRATAVLTNVGVPLVRCPLPRREGKIVVGDAVLAGFDLLAPVRRGTVVAFAVWKYAGRLNTTCHFDSRVLAADDARDLLDRFAARIRCTSTG